MTHLIYSTILMNKDIRLGRWCVLFDIASDLGVLEIVTSTLMIYYFWIVNYREIVFK